MCLLHLASQLQAFAALDTPPIAQPSMYAVVNIRVHLLSAMWSDTYLLPAVVGQAESTGLELAAAEMASAANVLVSLEREITELAARGACPLYHALNSASATGQCLSISMLAAISWLRARCRMKSNPCQCVAPLSSIQG